MVKKRLSSTISSKGQVTVPLDIRRRLGLREGDRVEFLIHGDQTLIRPATAQENPFERYIGILPAFEEKRQISRWISELRDDDDDNQR